MIVFYMSNLLPCQTMGLDGPRAHSLNNTARSNLQALWIRKSGLALQVPRLPGGVGDRDRDRASARRMAGCWVKAT